MANQITSSNRFQDFNNQHKLRLILIEIRRFVVGFIAALMHASGWLYSLLMSPEVVAMIVTMMIIITMIMDALSVK